MLRVTKHLAKQWFTPEEYQGDDDAPQFQVCPLNGAQMLEVNSYYDPETKRVTGKGILLCIRYGLKDWRNVVDENEKVLKFNEFNTNFLDSGILVDIASKIFEVSRLSEEDAKNS